MNREKRIKDLQDRIFRMTQLRELAEKAERLGFQEFAEQVLTEIGDYAVETGKKTKAKE